MRDEHQLRLVQRIQAGDSSAENDLFQKYKDPILWKIHRSIATDAENIKDVTSEVFLAILQGLRSKSFRLEGWESLEAYVWGVTNNKIRDWFKKNKRENNIFSDDLPAEKIAAASEEYLLENEELNELLKACLNTLESQYQQVLELRYFQELSVPEISAQLGMPPRRVSERIHYALKLLRQTYRKKIKEASILGLFLLFYIW